MSIRSRLQWVLYGRDESGRLRAVWRVLFPVVLTLAVGAILLPMIFIQLIPVGQLSMTILSYLSMLIAVGGVLYLSASYLDRRPLRDYGFHLSRRWFGELVVGTVVGGFLVASVFAVSHWFGWVSVVELWSSGDTTMFLAWILLFAVGWLAVGIWEETLFRGIFILNAAEGFETAHTSSRNAIVSAWVVSSLVFGILHVPLGTVPGDGSLLGMLLVWCLMGGLLGWAYVLSGELALPIGLHFSFNYAVNNVFFGVTASGQPALPTVIRTDIIAPDLWHPITGLPMLFAIGLGYVFIGLWITWRREERSLISRLEGVLQPRMKSI